MEYESDCSESLYEKETKQSSQITKRKNSYVWQYFEALNSKTFKCLICNSSVGNLTSNLARHLSSSHDINKPQKQGYVGERGRPSRSFIWKYCTKEDSKHALCHLCNNLLYFGGGNTSNITKHLRRKHMDILAENEPSMAEIVETNSAATVINCNTIEIETNNAENRRERKGASYVWNYCEKLSRTAICCKLCNKRMRFHGTANIITHLQRKHNILGKIDGETGNISNDNTIDINDVSEINDKSNNSDEYQPLRKRNSTTMSVVWKYCKRISRSVVRCNCCNKNLSYQGTSNLQRHLHRMHGIVTRSYRTNKSSSQLNTDFIWDYSKTIDDNQIQCNLCYELFDANNLNEIAKHLTKTHAITSSRMLKKLKRDPDSTENSSESTEEDDNWLKTDQLVNNDDNDFITQQKDDDCIYDIIEIDSEKPFDPDIIQEIPIANPLSPQTSDGDAEGDFFPECNRNSKKNNKIQKLNEDRLRMEAEYFREKAGYYRMQKYLTALQAKKVRIEMERLQNAEATSEFDTNVELH